MQRIVAWSSQSVLRRTTPQTVTGRRLHGFSKHWSTAVTTGVPVNFRDCAVRATLREVRPYLRLSPDGPYPGGATRPGNVTRPRTSSDTPRTGRPISREGRAIARVTYFRVLVQERRWTFEGFCAQWDRAARELAQRDGDPRLASIPLSRRTFDRWMSGDIGGNGPRPDTARILEHLFGVPVKELFGPPLQEHSPQEVNTCPMAVPAVRSTGGNDRSGDWGDLVQVLSETRELTTSNTDPALLLLAREAIEDIVSRYEAKGPHQLVGETRLLRRMLHTLLHGRQPSEQRRELFSLASRTSGLLSYMAVNAGRPEHAETYCAEAEALADMAGDLVAKMWALGTRALGLYYTGNYAESDAAASAGVALAPSNPQAIRLLVNGRARALARLGRREEATAAIGQALDLSDSQQQLPGGITACISFEPYSRARTLSNAMTAYLSLQETDEVQRYADELGELVAGSDSVWTQALVALDLATSYLIQDSPDLEQAVSLGQEALRVGGPVPIRSVTQRGAELLQHARPWHRDPLVRDYADELRVLTAPLPHRSMGTVKPQQSRRKENEGAPPGDR